MEKLIQNTGSHHSASGSSNRLNSGPSRLQIGLTLYRYRKNLYQYVPVRTSTVLVHVLVQVCKDMKWEKNQPKQENNSDSTSDTAEV